MWVIAWDQGQVIEIDRNQVELWINRLERCGVSFTVEWR